MTFLVLIQATAMFCLEKVAVSTQCQKPVELRSKKRDIFLEQAVVIEKKMEACQFNLKCKIRV